jgi:hypothetical protein
MVESQHGAVDKRLEAYKFKLLDLHPYFGLSARVTRGKKPDVTSHIVMDQIHLYRQPDVQSKPKTERTDRTKKRTTSNRFGNSSPEWAHILRERLRFQSKCQALLALAVTLTECQRRHTQRLCPLTSIRARLAAMGGNKFSASLSLRRCCVPSA